ncbi:MAG: c-type cytochrome [Gammaproteobacteria bacterium]|nr:c-type cytochrome [Gammaproteobacteria bacterium]
MKTIIQKLVILGVLGLLLQATALNASSINAYEGRKLFNTYCFMCHGSDGKSQGPLAKQMRIKPSDLTDSAVLGKISDRTLYRMIEGTIAHGSGEDQMPNWGVAIPGPSIKSLITYVRVLHGPKVVAGDPDEGKNVYDRYCTTCHGDSGNGRGVMTTVLPMKPQDLTDTKYMDTRDNDELRETITYGRSKYMPGWAGIISEEAIDSVIGYIRLLGHND